MKILPRIAITCERGAQGRGGSVTFLREDYPKAVANAGGVPVLLPVLSATSYTGETLNLVDGLLVSGGDFDVHPRFYGESAHENLGRTDDVRTRFELDLLNGALKKGVPILGICGGCQALNVAAGGSLYQDIASQVSGALDHKAQRSVRHRVSLLRGSKLARIFRGLTGRVNTSHHQAVKDPAPSFRATARARDGVIEAIEGGEHPFAVGVQWHPELLYAQDAAAASLFRSFLQAARTFAAHRRRS